MRDSRTNYVVVGGFTLLVLVGLVVCLALLAGRTGPTDAYVTVLRSVPGIGAGSQVLFQGHPVGRVEGIRLVKAPEGPRYRVELGVRASWRIPADSVAYLTTGLLSAVHVNIDGGVSDAVLSPGAEIPSREAPDIFASLSGVATDATALIGDLDAILEQNIAPLLETAGRQVQTLSERLDAVLSEDNVERIGRILTNAETTSGDTARLAAELRHTRRTVDEVLGRIDTLVAANQQDLEQAVDDLRYALESVARHIDAVNRNLEATSRNMNDFTREIRLNPALLLRGTGAADDGDGAAP
jgi:phospholipid/cholesterol/gamma-HCH transport system substrate-binding protein